MSEYSIVSEFVYRNVDYTPSLKISTLLGRKNVDQHITQVKKYKEAPLSNKHPHRQF